MYNHQSYAATHSCTGETGLGGISARVHALIYKRSYELLWTTMSSYAFLCTFRHYHLAGLQWTRSSQQQCMSSNLMSVVTDVCSKMMSVVHIVYVLQSSLLSQGAYTSLSSEHQKHFNLVGKSCAKLNMRLFNNTISQSLLFSNN